jgi:hypothetical protein
MGLYLFFIAASIIIVWGLVNGTMEKLKKLKVIRYEKQKLILRQQELKFEERELFHKYKEEVIASLDTLIKEKAQGFPWLATAISDYHEYYDKIFAKYLESKKRPALVKAEEIKRIALEKKLFKKEFLISKYIIKYYEDLFPWLREYVGFNSDELIKSVHTEPQGEEADPVSFYISQSEFLNLSVSERNQKALDRYWSKDKDPWQIGRDYERYIGYIYETRGYKVIYHGIEKIKDDLGRDLICEKDNQIEIVQCKYWSDQKDIPIREKHVTQLYGTTIKYFLDHKSKKEEEIDFESFPGQLKRSKILPVLITTTNLSQTALEFATILKVKTLFIPMDKGYPCIKCNINFQTGEKIYHLPFDQQYDRAMIDPSKGEYWAKTVKEAESLGFRRAWRWKKDTGL